MIFVEIGHTQERRRRRIDCPVPRCRRRSSHMQAPAQGSAAEPPDTSEDEEGGAKGAPTTTSSAAPKRQPPVRGQANPHKTRPVGPFKETHEAVIPKT